MKKNWLNRLKLKKTTGSVRFYKPETGKNRTEPKLKKIESNQKKPSKIEPNQFESVFILKNWTEPKPVSLNRFRFGFSCFFKKKILIWLFFFMKTKSNRK
jgi:hypothetical protein